MKIRLKIFMYILLVFNFSFLLADESEDVNIQIDISKAQLEDKELDNFDAEYIHDEEYIRIKSQELKDEVSNDYEKLDNLILYEAIMSFYSEWKGIKYKWGGDSKKGIDCSAFTRRVYRSVFNGYELPRVSYDQINVGERIKKSELKPGDLVYFRPNNNGSHITIYVGNSLFMHASSSKGVILSSMDNAYWVKYFKFGVRVAGAREE